MVKRQKRERGCLHALRVMNEVRLTATFFLKGDADNVVQGYSLDE